MYIVCVVLFGTPFFCYVSRRGRGTRVGAAGSLPLIGELPYQGKDTREFDEVLFSAELNVPVKAYSQWGVHLLLVEARGEGGAPLAGEGAAPVDALRP